MYVAESYKISDISARFEFENTFRRSMLSLLSPVETKVLVYVMDRTLGWMRTAARISYSEIATGREDYSQGAGVTKVTARRCIASLAEKGILQILSTSRQTGTWIQVNLEWGADMLKRPKKERKATKKRFAGSNTEEETNANRGLPDDPREGYGVIHGGLPDDPPIVSKGGKEFFKEEDTGGGAPEPGLQPVAKDTGRDTLTTEDAIAAGKNKQATAVATKREKMAKAANSGRVTPAMLEQYWADGEREQFGMRGKAWTRKEYGQAKHLMRSLPLGGKELLDFMAFCTSEWKRIIRSQFAWAKGELESFPNIGFVLKYANGFLHAWHNQEAMKDDERLSPDEQYIRRLMRRKGLSEHEARAQMEERKERARTRGKAKTPPPRSRRDEWLEQIQRQRPTDSENVNKEFQVTSEPMEPLQLDPLKPWED